MNRTCLTAVLGALAALLTGPVLAASTASAVLWNTLGSASGALHLKATYPGPGGGAQTLDFWRAPSGAVVRRTGGRAELRLTPSRDGEDGYQLRNLLKKVAFDVHRTNLYRVGILTDRWSVQHLLDRPTVPTTLLNLHQRGSAAGEDCSWYRISVTGAAHNTAPSEFCWSARLGVPLLIRAAGHRLLTVTAVQTQGVALPPAALPAGWNEFDADEDLAPD